MGATRVVADVQRVPSPKSPFSTYRRRTTAALEHALRSIFWPTDEAVLRGVAALSCVALGLLRQLAVNESASLVFLSAEITVSPAR
jgi:hypothetical protein